jgi:hypothetical protein
VATISDSFEERLLADLLTLVDPTDDPGPQRAHSPRRGRWLAAAAVAAAGTTAAIVPTVVLGGHGAGAGAYAVSRAGDGTVTVAINGVVVSPWKLQRELRRNGVPATVLPLDYRGPCQKARAAIPAGPHGLAMRDGNTVVIVPARIPRGATVIAQVPTRHGDVQRLRVQLSRSDKPACATHARPR